MGRMKDFFQGDMFDSPKARMARDLGMEQVSTNAADWMARALKGIASLPQGFEGNAEAIVKHLALPPPHHHNALGAMVSTASKRKLLIKTGRLSPCTRVRSHSRQAMVWRRT